MNSRLSQGQLYVGISFVLWILVEFITVWHSRLAEWLSLMPHILIQYLVIVLIFCYIIFKLKWSEARIFISMLIVMYIFEGLWQNSLLLNVLLFVPVSLLLISIWGFLTFVPLWFVRKSLSKHKLQAGYFLLWVVVAIIMLVL